MNQTQTVLMAYGLDSITAEKISKIYTLSKLKTLNLNDLLSLGISDKIAAQILRPTRTPIPQKNAEEVLLQSAFTCCICRQPGLPIVIHHINKWEDSYSHDLDNLAVLCLNHHGEAHSYHENSRNLTASLIKKAREQWYSIVQRQKDEAEVAVTNVLKYQGRWDYFNLSYIFSFIDDHNIRFNSRYRNDLIQKGLITESGMICSDRLTKSATHWINFFEGQYLKRYIEEMVNEIISCVPIRYIKGSQCIAPPVKPGELLLVDGRFYFKRMNKQTKGIGQIRRVSCTVNHMKFTGEIDAWYCNSSSAYSSHLTGNKSATQLCLVRSVNHVDSFDLIDCTIIGLGLNLTQPDLMAQLLESVQDRSKDIYEQEIDQLIDLQKGHAKGQYYTSPPDVCDICGTRFRNKKYMIDGAVKPSGIWANMCSKCYHFHGIGIEKGIGQVYLNQNNRWLLVGGFCDYEEDETDEELLLKFINKIFPSDKTE